MYYHPPESPKADILVVDDTPANLRLLSQMLAEHGYLVRPVPDGLLALAATQAQPPDLILLDIRMPEMDGYEVCRRLKADPQTRDIPIIFISALGETEDKVKAFSVGGVDYITKPFQIEEVLARVEAHLSLRRLQQQLQDANRRFEEELTLAGQIQASFLPDGLPHIPGWHLTATLQPAHETSGDFYDVIGLPDGRLGFVVADVADKGAGAALYMALSCTLFRTYAPQYPTEPERVMTVTNRRLLSDTHTSMFVTAWYGTLDPTTGMLTYCNAGHMPPYLFSRGSNDVVQTLHRTGLALGVVEDDVWQPAAVQLAPGDTLLLYSDGVTDAQNDSGEFFGRTRLLEALEVNRGQPARLLQDALLTRISDFVGRAPQSDDLTLMILGQDPAA